MTRVVLDFPSPGGAPQQRQLFGEPRRIISASEPAGVAAALRTAEACAAAGAWAVGYVAYEAATAFDSALRTQPRAGPAPLLWFGVFDAPVAAPPPRHAPVPAMAWTAATSREEYDAAIAEIRERIAAGDVYQVNHTVRLGAPCDTDTLALYDALVARRHGLYHALIETEDWAVVSASPELFFERCSRRITTRPMKGTLRRGRWLDEDRACADRLAASAKDRAENLMIVDLLRNDLGRVAAFGSVHVPALCAVETYPTVHQMTSTITAELRPDVSLCDIFTAMFPCGSVTGAPKVTAMRTIAELEDAPRGPYCGALGVIRPDGTAAFNVAIRTLLIDRLRGHATYGSGGGITWDSNAAAEYDELVAKAALLDDVTEDFQLIETMRCDDGTIDRVDYHLRRLAQSAEYWGFAADTADAAAAAIAAFAALHDTGSWRLRLTASRSGNISLEHEPLLHAAGSFAAPAAQQDIALAYRAVSRHDRLLFHKTTARRVHDAHRADHPHRFDVLLFNEEDEVTEFTTGNVVVEMQGTLLTPPRECGLLAGTMRQQLLDAGTIREAVIPLEQIRRAPLWHINSVRGCTPVRLR